MGDEDRDTTHIDVRYVAELARLALTGEEVAKFQKELGDVLHYMDQLNKLELEDVEPTAHATPRTNVLREDVTGEPLTREEVMRNAPAASPEQTYIRVPPIF